MEQRITRAKRRVAAADVPFETPGAVGARRAARRGRRDDLSALQRGLFGERRRGACARAAVRGGDPAGAAAAAAVSEPSPRSWACTALLLLQHARAPARLDADGDDRAARGSGSQLLESRADRRRARAGGQGAAPPAAAVPIRCRPRSPPCMRARARAEDTDWAEIEQLYAMLETLQPSPVVTLNRAVAVAKVRGPAAALDMIEPLARAALPATSTSSA